MKSFGKFLLYVGLFAFFVVGNALGKTHYVTQSGTGGTLSAPQFNNLRGDYSGETFFFFGDFNTRIHVKVYGSASGHVTLDGLQNGTCNPTTAVDLSLCSSGGTTAANLINGIELGTTGAGLNYVIVQDFNMDGTNSNESYMVRFYGGASGHNVFRRNTIVNAPGSFISVRGLYQFGGPKSTNFIMEDNKLYGKHRKSMNIQSMQIDSLTHSIFRRNIIGGDRNQVTWTNSNIGELIEIYLSSNVLIEYNQIFNSASQSLLRLKEGGLQENFVIRYNNLWGAAWQGISSYAGPQKNHYIYGNRIANSDTLGISIMSDTEDHHVWANLIYDIGHQGLTFREQLKYGKPQGIHFSNNTVVHNGFDPWTDRCGILSWDVHKHVRMFNNIVTYNDTTRTHPKNVISGTGSHHISGYNIVWSGDRTLMWRTNTGSDADKNLTNMQALGRESNTLVADPLLANIGSVPTQKRVNVYKDLRLTADSPAIDSGQDLSDYGSFSVNLSGGSSWFQNYTGYGTITFSYNDGLHPSTDWTTPIPSVVPAKFSDYGSGWERGAYVFDEGNSQKTIITDLNETTILNPPGNFKIFN